MRRRMGRRGLALAVAAVTVAAIGGTALAAFPQDTVRLYTGCLNSGGNITSVAEGDSPLQPCSSPKQVVKLSGGDITSLSVSAPLTGGGTNGAVSIGLSASATLPSCSSTDQVPKWNNTTSRWTCGVDNDTKYSAGTGLDLTGTTFFVESDAFTKKGQACPSGFATGVDSSGVLTCAPASSKPAIWIRTDSYADVPDLAVPGDFTKILELSVPLGSYLATATAKRTTTRQMTMARFTSSASSGARSPPPSRVMATFRRSAPRAS